MNATTAPRRSRRAAWMLGCGLVLLVSLDRAALGQSGLAGLGPSVAAGGGLRMTVDTHWVEGGGYRPVRITLTPIVPPVADRTLSVEFSSEHPWRHDDDIVRVVQDVEIPAGSGPVAVTLSVPNAVWLGQSWVRVSEDGQLIPGLDVARAMSRRDDRQEEYPCILVVADKLPDSAALGHLFMVEEDSYDNQGNLIVNQNGLPFPSVVALVPAELPRRWIDYSSLDLVCLSLDQLRLIRRQQPEVFSAIRDWTAGGGNLLVWDVELNASGLAELETLLDIPEGRDNPPEEQNQRCAVAGWTQPNRSAYGNSIRGTGTETRDPFDPLPADADSQETKKPRGQQSRSAPDESPFVFRPFDLGMVVAYRQGDPFDAPPVIWAWLLNSVGSDRFLWSRRHGFSCYQDTPEFYQFLIPGVGLAPVWAFRVLITLFVLVIGPLNYLLLRRWRRLHLLILTVPGGAGVVTLALFGYAIVADGLGTRVRVRSLTLIDQQTGQAACWSRLSYYAGLAPGRGLTFPADVAVIPIDPFSDIRRLPTREVVWDDRQHLVSGWLRSRTPTQFLTVRSRPSDLGLAVGPPDADAQELPIENRLGVHVEQVVVRTADGRRFAADDVAAGATVRATEEGVARIAEAIRQVIRENKPAYPVGMGKEQIVQSSRSWYSGYYPGDLPPVTMRSSCLERHIGAVEKLLAGGANGLAPRTYIAIVRRSPEVELGTPEARSESSLHVVIGTW